MEFVIDRVSEDSFYENVLIGLQKTLEKLPSVSDFTIERTPPVAHNLICAWEQKHGVLLPEDLRQFYASTNGLSYTYNYDFLATDEIRPEMTMGRIKINNLGDLNQIYGYEIDTEPCIISTNNGEGQKRDLKLGPDSKIFELDNLYDVGRVVLVYFNHRYLPSVWMHNSAMKFHFLADDFTTYMRMSIHHLGIPLWQFSFTPEGVPEWSEMIFRLLAPGILNKRKITSKCDASDFSDVPLNKIDSAITKATGRMPHKTTEMTVHHERDSSPRMTKKKTKPLAKGAKKPLSHHRK